MSMSQTLSFLPPPPPLSSVFCFHSPISPSHTVSFFLSFLSFFLSLCGCLFCFLPHHLHLSFFFYTCLSIILSFSFPLCVGLPLSVSLLLCLSLSFPHYLYLSAAPFCCVCVSLAHYLSFSLALCLSLSLTRPVSLSYYLCLSHFIRLSLVSLSQTLIGERDSLN